MQAIDMHLLQELVRLHRLGLSSRVIAKRLGISRNTERKYRGPLTDARMLEGDPAALPELAEIKAVIAASHGDDTPATRPSSIEDWAEAIEAMLDAGAGPTAIYDRLRLDERFEGSLGAVKRLCARVRKVKGIAPEDVAIRVETPAGEVAQVDFGYVGKLYDADEGRLRKAWAFVMVLAFSRLMVVRIVFDQKVETWLRCHAEAFAELGGVPKVIVPDNLKAAVIRAGFGVDDKTTLNRSYREFARFFGFQVDPTPVRAPEKKGKVESGVKYVKNNFFAARKDLLDVGELRVELRRWLDNIANSRTHGTTQRRPAELFAVEREHLLALPSQRWEPVVWREAKVHTDTHVQVDRAMYSVPWRLVGKPVLIRLTKHSVEIYWDDVRVATHARQQPGKRSTIDAHLPEIRRDFRHRSRDFWEQRADALGEDVGAYIREVFDADDVLSQLRTVQSIVTHLETFPVERARATCRRASFYGLHSYGGIKNILRKGLDLEPLPIVVQRQGGVLEPRRFTRDIGELLQLPLEKTDAPN
ncbi:Mobile element protein [Enhygromyxa salina]|uniref:Mobile element protein n=1 Tax=Enhygromyxa salina TaxID=215803 RepID=A0A0C2CKI5_9BACT|nr:IS21 family transposase [Enhygromyxa salina]KIG11706.1 Mobile element protein [Enhygromyxa salina]